jgi:membrane associated rhomboid family serine protease
MRKALGADLRSTLTLLAINVVIAVVVPNIDWRAHLGGLLGGVLTSLILKKESL